MNVSFLATPQGRKIAHVRHRGDGPEVVFFHGLQSEMEGTKALALEVWAQRHGRAYLRFDCSGHGQSSGEFQEGTISRWLEDAEAVINDKPGPKILVGSSMGAWLALLLARDARVEAAGLVGIAAAPDFTNGAPPWPTRPQAEREELARDGRVTLPNPYEDEPTVLSRALIEDGLANSIFGPPLRLDMPVRLFHGTADAEVPVSVAMALMEHAESPDMHLTLVKNADHRFSTPDCLSLVEAAVQGMPV